ncbi:hypothetical protein WAI453_004831 [Rhynchosporium graminicola]|uniref:Related to rhamnogalacturonan acetylesterase n=1 Tax=Rhynchosporium graminicola TaxID=2792576 RepID=A0A1E1LQL4_9HELO|nr:related to rhamnogalacturonan acetylesterase precursor [Rhynchosporium commune]
MKYSLFSLPALLALASAAPSEEIEMGTTPTIYLAGDSTMALGGGPRGTEGWGVFLPFSVKDAKVVNAAIGGRSARSYFNEGRFTRIADKVVPGDYVVFGFGHNDGGSLEPDNGRTDCLGSGNETCITSAGLIVQTYVTYLTQAAKAIVAKGAKVIISSPTPNNICEGTGCAYTAPRYTAYCRQVVSNVGSNLSFIDLGQYLANEYIRLGKATVDSFYPIDHTHTSPAGANVVAQSFVKAVLCGNGVLAPYIKNGTSDVAGNCA